VAGSTDQEPLADDNPALELASHLSLLDGSLAFEETALGDLHLAAFVQTRLYTALDYQPIAGLNLAREGYLAADNHRPAFCPGQLVARSKHRGFYRVQCRGGTTRSPWRHKGLCNWPCGPHWNPEILNLFRQFRLLPRFGSTKKEPLNVCDHSHFWH